MKYKKQFWIDTLGKGWAIQLQETLKTEYGTSKLMGFVGAEYAINKVKPNKENIFKAFKLCPWESTRVVIIGKQPHRNVEAANGLAYGNEFVTQFYSPVITRIFEQVEREFHNGLHLGFDFSLEDWAKQGVLLLNKQLTIREDDKGEHTKPWGKFISAVLNALNQYKPGTIYILWGEENQKLKPFLEKNNHVLTFDDPKDYVYPKKDWHCPNFKEANVILNNLYKETIKW